MSMVLPLQKICLAAIRDTLMDRPNPYLHEIPPPNARQNLRLDLLDLVQASGVIRHESAYTSLSSPEYLDGLSKVSTQRGIISDHEFLDRVADSLSVHRNGRAIGEGITELRFNIYTWWRLDGVRVSRNLNSAVRIISQCPNLKILHLSIVEDTLSLERRDDSRLLAGLPAVFGTSLLDGGILNQVPAFAPCSNVLENVEELSLSSMVRLPVPCLARNHPIINFRCLSSLRLANVLVDAEAWKEFLMVVKNSLIEFEASSLIGLEDNYTNWILPFSLPNLRSFIFSGRYTVQLIKNLMECPKLEKIKMPLKANEEEDAMRLLSRMNSNISVEIRLYLEVGPDRDQYFDRGSNFKWVNLFKEKIKKVQFLICRWNTEHSTALKNFFAACPDLVEFGYHVDPRVELGDGELVADHTNRLMAAFNANLVPYLRDQSFVSKLHKLELRGPFDHDVLDALFENAANLESLEMENCPQLSDLHLQLWASCGGKPTRLVLRKCVNITDQGLVPILVSSGERMKQFDMGGKLLAHISKYKFTLLTLFEHCPFFPLFRYYFHELSRFLDSECP